jgi:hemoglobin
MRPKRSLGTGLCLMLLLSGWLAHPAFARDSLYQRLGGEAGIAHIARDSVALWLADDRIKTDFDNINLDRLRTRLTDQICQLVSGPCVYHGRSMQASHAGLDLTQAKFNAVAEDLQTAMERIGIPYWTQNQLMALLAPMQRHVVTK